MSAAAALTATPAGPPIRIPLRVFADEYTPGSVAADPADAVRLGLVRAADGNSATPPLDALAAMPAPAARG